MSKYQLNIQTGELSAKEIVTLVRRRQPSSTAEVVQGNVSISGDDWAAVADDRQRVEEAIARLA